MQPEVEVNSLRLSELSAVSRYWTPAHLDVTDAPVVYAKPKPAWIDRMDRFHPLAAIDEADRFRRRMINDRLAIEANEIPDLPPLEMPAATEALAVPARWKTGARHLLRRLAYR